MKIASSRLPVALLALASLVGGCGGEPADEEAVATTAGLDPAPYRAEVEAVEAILYRPGAADVGTFDRVGQAVMATGAAVLRGHREPRAREAGTRMLNLGGAIGARGDAGYDVADLPSLRREWEAARNELFRPAGWFRGRVPGELRPGQGAAVAALDRAQTPAGPPPLSAADRRRYERALNHFERLSDDGLRACRRLGEPDYDISVTTARSTRHVRAWQDWSRGWRADVLAGWDDMPDRPGFDGQPDLLQAWQHLAKASQHLQDVPRGVGMWPVPFEAQWEQRIAAARTALAAARDHLARVPDR